MQSASLWLTLAARDSDLLQCTHCLRQDNGQSSVSTLYKAVHTCFFVHLFVCLFVCDFIYLFTSLYIYAPI